jgi:aminoglycoside phosphotransferase (APT) family kinase protein
VPVPISRDSEVTRQSLQRWFDTTATGLTRVHVDAELKVPGGAGNSNETILFSIRHDEAGDERSEDLVLRIESRGFALFMDANLEEEVNLLQAFRECVSFPAPGVRWFEAREDVLGAPFVIMDRAPGRVPDDDLANSWVKERTVEERRRVWENGFRALCAIHTDLGTAQAAEVLTHRLAQRSGLEEQLDYWSRYRSCGCRIFVRDRDRGFRASV